MARFERTVVSFVFVMLLAVSAFAADAGYHLTNTYKVGGEGGWDYIYADTAGRRLCIPRGATRAQRLSGCCPGHAGRRERGELDPVDYCA